MMNQLLVTNTDFLKAVFAEDAPFVHVTDFPYDPGAIPPEKNLKSWAGDWSCRYQLTPNTNQYFCISIFSPDPLGKARRRKALYLRTPCIVLDDVKEKLSMDMVRVLPEPSWILETSPGSEQWGYILDVPCSERSKVENLLDGLVANGLAPQGKDPGMKGVTRYVRLPEGVNNKAAKLVNGLPFKCRMLEWRPDRRVTMEQLADPFFVDLNAVRREARVDGAADLPDHPLLQIPDIIHLKEERSDGRFDVTCPWVEEHTGADDSGAGIFTNKDGTIGFKCHHGSCQERTGKDLLRFVEEEVPGWTAGFNQWKAVRMFEDVPRPECVANFDHNISLGIPDQRLNGAPKGTLTNLRYLMMQYKITATYDVIAKKVKIHIPGSKGVEDNVENTTLSEIISLASLYSIPNANIPAFVSRIADENPVNPVEDWILSKPWDGLDRLSQFYQTLTTVPGYPQYLKELLLRKWMISAVAAAFSEDKFDARGVLTLQGPQSIGKTQWIRSLVGPSRERSQWVKIDHLLDPTNKDSVLGAVSHWLVELGELDATFRRSDIAKLKGFITNHEDKIRRPYDRRESHYQRRTVFLATVNDTNFLVDPTGNTRFWTLELLEINYQHELDMQQVWRQVADLYEAGEQWWLTQAEETQLEEINRSHRVVSAIRELILSHVDKNATPRSRSAGEVLRFLNMKNPTNPQCKEAAAVLGEQFGESKMSQGLRKWDVTLRSPFNPELCFL